jgi:hypothetical protein
LAKREFNYVTIRITDHREVTDHTAVVSWRFHKDPEFPSLLRDLIDLAALFTLRKTGFVPGAVSGPSQTVPPPSRRRSRNTRRSQNEV